MRRAIPYPCISPMVASVCNTITSRVPCNKSSFVCPITHSCVHATSGCHIPLWRYHRKMGPWLLRNRWRIGSQEISGGDVGGLFSAGWMVVSRQGVHMRQLSAKEKDLGG